MNKAKAVERLIETAVQAQKRAYCPYSRYRVGAAVLTETGRVFAGCNVENASYGLAMCAERVAIWDFDAHHGNGTEAIVTNNPRIRFASIHQFPAYPGTGVKSFANIDNYPVAPFTRRNEHVDLAKRALEKLVAFKPELILVSAGFDAYARDPLVQMTLEREDFATFGEWLHEIDIPTAAILEGGYSNELPELIESFLSSWMGEV